MNLKDAVASLQQSHPEDSLIPLYTVWGEEIKRSDREDVWQEYPRPQLQRDNYRMLNGRWQYAFTSAAQAESTSQILPGTPIPAQGTILVPFSPESLLSGVKRQLQPEEFLWYEKSISFSSGELARKARGQRCILHFDAADQQAAVYADGRLLASHTGGYLPFTADLTHLVSHKPLLLQVRIRDHSDTSYHARGKQTLNRGGMFYTAQSGIWQSVWYEWVPDNYVKTLKITPDMDKGIVMLELKSDKAFSHVSCIMFEPVCREEAFPKGSSPKIPLEGISIEALPGRPGAFIVALPGESLRLWTPEEPYLYPFALTADEDTIQSYFALRSFTVEPDEKGIPRFCLNHRPYFLHGLLDQGYWPDGLMTAPCDEAFVWDIRLAKEMGFNMLRKHIKLEPLRWYYHCDRLGMIVWQDMVSGGSTYHMPLVCYLPTLFPHITAHTKDHHYRLFSRADQEGRRSWEQECLDTVEHLYNVPCLAAWVPFNEGWGQFDAARIADLVKEKDPTRPVDHASGWFDQKGGDFRSIHNYFRPLKVEPDGKRAFVISEYGGFACHIPGHSSVERIFGYRKYDTPEEMTEAFQTLIHKQLFPLKAAGLSGAVYTQLSDVEEEVNGLTTYDRRVIKVTLRSQAPGGHREKGS